MLCDECIKELAIRLSMEAQAVFHSLEDGSWLNKTQLIEATNLSYSITHFAIRELEGANLVVSTTIGTAKIYQLSQNGIRLITLLERSLQKNGA